MADLKRVSVVEVTDESLLNPIISVNGSSPAYCYLFIKAMLDSAAAQGISAEIAQPLILQTVEGAVEMVRRSGKSIDALIREVSSPGGTTLAALASFEKKRLCAVRGGGYARLRSAPTRSPPNCDNAGGSVPV